MAHDHSSRPRVPLWDLCTRRTFLGAAGLSVAGVLGARAAFAVGRAGVLPASTTAESLPASAIDDLAFALEYDVDRIFRYVTDEIWYEPYGGVLRGATGTLESRAGNAADKSLLLAALLDASVVPYRFVIGTLDDAAADALWTSVQVDTTTAQDHAAAVLTRTPTGDDTQAVSPSPAALTPGPTGTLEPGGQTIVDGLARDPLPIIATASAMLDTGVRLVHDALASGGIAVPKAPYGLNDLERSQHVWVQALQGVDWVDLDPALAAQAPGAQLGAPVATELATLPDALRHRVEIKVSVERVLGTGLEQVDILEYADAAEVLGGQPMALLHVAPGDLQGAGIAIGNALQGVVQYQPILQVGDTTHVGAVGVQLAAGDDGGVLGALGGSGHDGEATAEWLDVTVTAPDGRTAVARRTLFDRIGPSVRAAGVIDPAALPALPTTQLAEDAPGVPTPLLALHFLAVATGATSSQVLDGVDPDDDSPWGLRVGPHAYHLSRDAANATAALERGVRVFHDAPNVTRYVVEVPPGRSDGSFSATLDVLARSFAAVPVVGVPADPAPGVVAGVLSHVAERLAFGAAAPDGSAPDDVSVGHVLDQAVAQGIPITAFAPGDDVSALPFTPEAMDLLRAGLDAGSVAIAPVRPVDLGGTPRVGWYLFDPVSGALVDQMDSGNGQTMSEYAGLVGNLWRAYGAYVRLGICVALIVKELKTLLQLTSGGSTWSLATGLGAGAALGGVHKWACH